MKKLTRTSLSALKRTSTVLTEQQQRAIKGGCSLDQMGVGYWIGGNYYWYRTSECTCGSSYDSGNTGYGYGGYNYWGSEPNNYGGYGYNYGSWGGYPGEGIMDCVIQSLAYMYGLSTNEVYAMMIEVMQELYGWGPEASAAMAGSTGANLEQVEAITRMLSGSCYSNSYNSSSSMCALGLTKGGHAIALEYYDSSSETYSYWDEQQQIGGTISASDLLWVISGQ
ncbi:hypothetical protein [Dysgonomonas termitidis]|uniref:Peptidase C39-like domain-containing protein n=1 Tax=Dysgonomonas termitidis TaxID=1516126 RepID=A0ABV9KRH2_9BACT